MELKHNPLPAALKIARYHQVEPDGDVLMPKDLLSIVGEELFPGNVAMICLDHNCILVRDPAIESNLPGYTVVIKKHFMLAFPRDYLRALEIDDGDYFDVAYSSEKQAIVFTPCWKTVYPGDGLPKLDGVSDEQIAAYITECRKQETAANQKREWYQRMGAHCRQHLVHRQE